jgi:hypothetical protein
MKKFFSNIKLVIFLAMLFGSFQSYGHAASLEDVLYGHCKGFFGKIKCKASDYNPIDYFEKRKQCIRLRDKAETVFKGKQRYKNCMKN